MVPKERISSHSSSMCIQALWAENNSSTGIYTTDEFTAFGAVDYQGPFYTQCRIGYNSAFSTTQMGGLSI